MQKKTTAFILCLLTIFILTGCGGPSEEKVAAAQETYEQLVAIHNQTVEAHKTIDDDFLDQELSALLSDVKQLGSHNLNEMEDADIDLLIEDMNAMISSYQACLDKIQEFKDAKEAARLTPVFFTLSNQTDMTFLNLALCAKGDSREKTNVLENTDGFVPGQVLTGLMVFRDTSNTPWILRLENTEEEAFAFPLKVEELKEEGEALALTCDSETGELLLEH